MVDRDEPSVTAAAEELSASGNGVAEPFVLDVTDRKGLDRLASRVTELGTFAPSRMRRESRPPWLTGGASSSSTS